MISKIKIVNYQSHKRTLINLHHGVNVFVGQSDKGKTGIIRAIRWLVYNKPAGDEFRSWWGGSTSVQLTFDDGNTITRVKSNTENYYQINEETPLKAFGQGVPQEVQKILNLEDVNIQQQLDAPFLLSETAGEVAAHFNRIAGISVIDRSLTKAKSAIAKTKQSIEHREADLQEKQEQLTGYKDLDTIEKQVKYLSDLEGKKKQIEFDTVVLKTKIGRLNIIEEESTEIKEYLQLEKPVKNLLEKDKLWTTVNAGLKKLRILVLRINTIDKQLTDSNTLLDLEPAINLLLFKVKQKGLFQGDLKALNNSVGKYTTLTNKWQENQEKLVELNNTLTVYWGSTEFCPLCKQEIKHEHIN